MQIKQSSAAYALVFLMLDSTNHIDGKTGLSPTVRIGKNGGAGAAPAGAVTEIDATNQPGWYKVAGNATDSNTLGSLILHASASGADPTDMLFEIVAYDPQNPNNLGLGYINVAFPENFGMFQLDELGYIGGITGGNHTLDGVLDGLREEHGEGLWNREGLGLAAANLDTQLANILAAATGGSGAGAYTITVSVTDGTDPLQNAIVRLIEGANIFVATSDVNGEAVFALDAATYAVAITKVGYQFTPTTRTVTGSESGTLTSPLVMTPRTIPSPPVNPDFCTVYGYIETPAGLPSVGTTVTFTLQFGVAPQTGIVTTYDPVVGTTDADGLFSVDIRKGTYLVASSPIGLNATVTFSTDTRDLSFII